MTASVDTVTNADLRKAMEKIVALYIKTTGKTGDILFGNKDSKGLGLVAIEMNLGIKADDAARDAGKAQAMGQIAAGAFSIASGCMAMGGGAYGASAAGESLTASQSLSKVPSLEDAPSPLTQGELGAGKTAPAETPTPVEEAAKDSKQAVELELQAAKTQRASDESPATVNADEEGIQMEDMSAHREKHEELGKRDDEAERLRRATAKDTNSDKDIDISLQERRTDAVENSQNTSTDEGEAEGRIDKIEDAISKDERATRQRKIDTTHDRKRNIAQGIMGAGGAFTGMGNITQSQYTQEQATHDQQSKTQQAAEKATGTSTQQAQKFFGDIHSGVQAAVQTVELVNQTVVASSRI